jgi:predicted Zn-dependent peptidase
MEIENTKTGLPAGVKKVDLENGLVVILKEDHSSPVATVQAWPVPAAWMKAPGWVPA